MLFWIFRNFLQLKSKREKEEQLYAKRLTNQKHVVSEYGFSSLVARFVTCKRIHALYRIREVGIRVYHSLCIVKTFTVLKAHNIFLYIYEIVTKVVTEDVKRAHSHFLYLFHSILLASISFVDIHILYFGIMQLYLTSDEVCSILLFQCLFFYF